MVELFPLIPILNPYGSHTVMGGQHWNHRGPISVSHGSHLGPNYVSRKYHFSRIISILSRGSHILECIFIVIKFYQYGTYGAQVGPKWDKCPESANMVPIYTCLLVKVYQYGTYIGLIWAKKPIWGPCRTRNAQILPIWVPYIHVCWVPPSLIV